MEIQTNVPTFCCTYCTFAALVWSPRDKKTCRVWSSDLLYLGLTNKLRPTKGLPDWRRSSSARGDAAAMALSRPARIPQLEPIRILSVTCSHWSAASGVVCVHCWSLQS